MPEERVKWWTIGPNAAQEDSTQSCSPQSEGEICISISDTPRGSSLEDMFKTATSSSQLHPTQTCTVTGLVKKYSM